MKIVLYLLCLLVLIQSQQSTNTNQNQAIQPLPQKLAIMAVGQTFPGQINYAQSRQSVHFIKIDQIEKKYLFIRLNTYDKVRTAIGLYNNETRQAVYACSQNSFDSCYIPGNKLKQNTTYVILIVSDGDIRYNMFSYWADLQHLKPNQQIKFMFDSQNPNQLFHLQFTEKDEFEQIRLILSPQTKRNTGDNLKIFANIGFHEEPTVQKHQYESIYVWGDAQAILLSKDQVGNNKGISIYIVGNAETIYNFDCQFIKQRDHEIQVSQVVNDYLPRQKQASYRVNFKQNNFTDSFVIKVSSFTGEIGIKFFYDKQHNKQFTNFPYQYMSDLQFNFEKKDFVNGTFEIYMVIKSFDSQSTYQISTQARNKELAFEITENVYEFTLLNNPKQAMYFYSHVWESQQFEKQKLFDFDVSMIKIFGDPSVSYYSCKNDSSQENCRNITNKDWNKYVSRIQHRSVQAVGTKVIQTLQVSSFDFKSINNVEKRLMMIVLLERKNDEQAGLAIQYSDPNQVRVLREGRAFQDKVKIQKSKYYKYVNNNPDILQIRIHINQISGLTRVKAKRDKIKDEDGQVILLDKNVPNTIVIKDKITEPIYLQIHGVVTSLYTISVSAQHKEHMMSNALIMAEDVQYEVKLLPYQHINVELHPVQSQITFQYYAEGGEVMICQVDIKGQCIGNKTNGASGQIKIDASNIREARLRIGNYVQQNANKKLLVNNIKLTLIYHSLYLDHCDERRLNKVYSQNIKTGACLKFHLPIPSQVQMMISRSDLSQTQQLYFLCNKKVNPIQQNNRLILKADLVKESCKQKLNQINLQVVISDVNSTQLKVDYSVEYFNDTIVLADGVAYYARGLSTSQFALRTFFYEILDQDRDINIMMYNKKGNQRFYAKIVNKPDRYTDTVSESEAKFNSKDSNYYTNPYIKITKQNIQDSNCGRTCVVILSIYSTQKSGTQIEYAIEVTQNHVVLKQNQLKKDFLPKSSAKFYEYESKKEKSNLIFRVSDNNRKCARVIMSKSPFPSGSNYFVKENEGTITYQKNEKGIFYFAVQAIEDCPYTVSITEGQTKITKLQYGQFVDVQIKAGQTQWFYTKHITNSSFKIISLKKHGDITIFVNQTDLSKSTIDKINSNKMNLQQFLFKNGYINTVAITSDNKNFCFNCYYVIAVKASQNTETSLFLGGDSSKLALSEEKILFDQIHAKNAVTFATFYKVSDGKLEVKVHSGKISFEISYLDQSFSKQFNKNKKVYHEVYNFTKQEGKYLPLQIRIKALQIPALYSFELIPSQSANLFQRKVNPGQHTFIYLTKEGKQCFSGTLSQNDQEVFISTDASSKFSLSNLELEVKIQNNLTEKFQKQIVGNILSIKFNEQIQNAKKYNVCLNAMNSEGLSIFVFQNKNVNLIHSDTEVLVRNQKKFALYPSGDMILDVFQCKGSVEIYYGNDLSKIRQQKSRKLEIIGIPGQTHAIRIADYSTLYLDIIAPMATVLWMPLKQSQERGVGYFKYSIGGLQYSSKFNSLQFKIGGVYKSKQTKTKVLNVRYTLYITKQKQILQQAVMCEKIAEQNFVSAVINTQSVGINKETSDLTILIDKKTITDQFPENVTLYYNVVADLTLEPPQKLENDDHQHYRFIYFQQVVPSEVFRQNKIQSMNLSMLIPLALVAIFGFVLISCIFVKYIVPAIGKLKNRVLVEQRDDPKDQSIPIPPSSDRNQIPAIPSGTQQEMK